MLAHIQRQCGAAVKCSWLAFQSGHFFAVGTSQHGLHLERCRYRLRVIASDGHFDVQVCIAVIAVKISGHIPVEQSGLGRGIEPYIVEDAGQPPVVLSFEVEAVAVFHDLHGQRVAPFLQEACDVVLGRLLSTLVVAHLLSVDP